MYSMLIQRTVSYTQRSQCKGTCLSLSFSLLVHLKDRMGKRAMSGALCKDFQLALLV